MLKLTLRHFGRFSVFKNSLNLILSTLWSLFGFQISNDFEKRERSVRYSFLSGSLSQRTCPGQMTTLWWPASSHMDITSHYAFFASTRNSWMELFPANFCQCIVQINFKRKGTDRVQNSDLILKRIYIGVFCDQARALRTVAGKHRKCTKRNLKLQSKSIKLLFLLKQI